MDSNVSSATNICRKEIVLKVIIIIIIISAIISQQWKLCCQLLKRFFHSSTWDILKLHTEAWV